MKEKCVNRLVCEHFNEDYQVFGDNVLLRAAGIMMATLTSEKMTLDEVTEIMNVAWRSEYNGDECARTFDCQDILNDECARI